MAHFAASAKKVDGLLVKAKDIAKEKKIQEANIDLA